MGDTYDDVRSCPAPPPCARDCLTMFAELPHSPDVSLEPAPLSGWSPVDDRPGDQWAGFWGADDAYYLRLTSATGAERWFAGAGPVEATRSVSSVLVLRAGVTPRTAAVLVGRAAARGAERLPTVLAGRAGRSLRRPA